MVEKRKIGIVVLCLGILVPAIVFGQAMFKSVILPILPNMGAESSMRETEFIKTKVFALPAVSITQKYMSMQGPTRTETFELGAASKSPFLWIKKYRVDVLNDQEEAESTEFLCHAWLTSRKGDQSDVKRRIEKDDTTEETPNLFLTISQGMEEMQFPEGFAVKVDNRFHNRLKFLGMAVNNNYEEIDKKVKFQTTIEYLEDDAARELNIKPLTAMMLPARQELKKVGGAHHRHHMTGIGEDEFRGIAPARERRKTHTEHWMVPPGKHIYRSDVKSGGIKSNGMIHFIKLHLHAYGQSMTLLDKTTGEEIWTGYAENHPEGKAHLLNTDYYTSTEGMPVFENHQYELITVYDNPTDHDIDAMGVLRLYVHRGS